MKLKYLFLSLMLVAAAASTAEAHELFPERTLLMQVSPDYAEVMLVYYEPPGPLVNLFLTRYDSNNNKTIDDDEVLLAAPFFAKRAFYGINTEFINETPIAKPIETKFKRTKDNGISAAFYLRYELNGFNNRHFFRFSVNQQSQKFLPISVTIQPGNDIHMFRIINDGPLIPSNDWAIMEKKEPQTFSQWFLLFTSGLDIFGHWRMPMNRFSNVMNGGENLYFQFTHTHSDS